MTLHVPDVGPDDDTLGAAPAYAAAGWYCLPVRRRARKHPGSVVGNAWQHQSTRDPEQLAAWLAGTDHGIALHAGRSGAVVADVDHPDRLPDALGQAIAAAVPPGHVRPQGRRRGVPARPDAVGPDRGAQGGPRRLPARDGRGRPAQGGVPRRCRRAATAGRQAGQGPHREQGGLGMGRHPRLGGRAGQRRRRRRGPPPVRPAVAAAATTAAAYDLLNRYQGADPDASASSIILEPGVPEDVAFAWHSATGWKDPGERGDGVRGWPGVGASTSPGRPRSSPAGTEGRGAGPFLSALIRPAPRPPHPQTDPPTPSTWRTP